VSPTPHQPTSDSTDAADAANASTGRVIVRAARLGAAVFTLSAVGAVVSTDLRVVAFAVAMGLFAVGIGVFFWAYAVALGRSRTDAIGIGGLFFLAGGVAPPAARRGLLVPLIVEVATALATAGARPFTSLAFGVLAPLYGLALTGLWAARHGRFEPR